MQLYTVDRQLHITGQGDTTLEGALATVERYRVHLKDTYASGEEAISASTFGFTQDDGAFLEVYIEPGDWAHLRIGPVEVTRKVLLFLTQYATTELEADLNDPGLLTEAIAAFFTKGTKEFVTYFRTLKPSQP